MNTEQLTITRYKQNYLVGVINLVCLEGLGRYKLRVGPQVPRPDDDLPAVKQKPHVS